MNQRRPGSLGGTVLDALWANPDGSTSNQVRDAFPEPKPKITTVLTVLDRLREKGLVRRTKSDGRGYLFFATVPRDDSVVKSMVQSLTSATNRNLALLNFAGNLTAEDRAILRKALGDE